MERYIPHPKREKLNDFLINNTGIAWKPFDKKIIQITNNTIEFETTNYNGKDWPNTLSIEEFLSHNADKLCEENGEFILRQ